MSALTETVNKLQQSLATRQGTKSPKRKRGKGPASIFSDVSNVNNEPPSESNLNSDMSDGNISSDDSSSDDDGASTKRQKLTTEDGQAEKLE